jgi:hypothetical protein
MYEGSPRTGAKTASRYFEVLVDAFERRTQHDIRYWDAEHGMRQSEAQRMPPQRRLAHDGKHSGRQRNTWQDHWQ